MSPGEPGRGGFLTAENSRPEPCANHSTDLEPGRIRAVNVPGDLKYTKSHEWVRVDGDTATIGITDHAQSELGDIVYVDLPNVGLAVQTEQSFGTVESVKTVSDLYAPVGGQVVEVNATLGAQSELVNTDPYTGGWLVKIKMADPSEAEKLLDADSYKAELG